MSSYEQPMLGEPYPLSDAELGITPHHKLADQGIIPDDEAALLADPEGFPLSRQHLHDWLVSHDMLESYLADLALVEE